MSALRCLWYVRHVVFCRLKEIHHTVCLCLFLLRVCLCVHVCVIIMSWSEAIWVGWLICICGVNRYKYSWPGSKLVWIFILPPGRRRVEWLWFQSAEQKLTQPFFVVDENTWWLPWASFGMLGELHMYMDYFICFSHMVAVFDVHRGWGSIARKTERQMEANTNSTCLGTKTVWDDAVTLQNGQEAAVQRIQQSPIKKLRRQDWEASWWCQPTYDAVQPTQLNVACLSVHLLNPLLVCPLVLPLLLLTTVWVIQMKFHDLVG